MLLNCHTYYSFRYGTLKPEELLSESSKKGYQALAVTDINNTAACIDIFRQAKTFDIKPVVGAEFRNGMRLLYIALAKNNRGFQEINEYLTTHLHEHEAFLEQAPAFENVYVIYPFEKMKPECLREHEFVGVRPKELTRLAFSEWEHHQNKLVILQPVTFLNKKGFNTHRLLRAIDNNILLSQLTLSEQTTPDEVLPSRQELLNLYKDYPKIIANSERLLDDCTIDFELGKNKNKKCFYDSFQTDLRRLREECEEGLKYRYSSPSQTVLQRMEMELRIIEQMKFAAYFLINWDLVRYAQRENYFYIGRGSGANSMVAYLLRITDVDPIELDLYFERFINPSRRTPPDFDIDFSWTDREDITDYLFRTHGYEHTALLGSYNTFKNKAMIRELGKVFGLPDDQIKKLQAHPEARPADQVEYWVDTYSKYISGFPSHISVHASGILISEKPMTAYSATFLPPKGFATTQFDMYLAEDAGLYKFDILSQRGLGKIRDSISIIQKNKDDSIDIHDVKRFKKDKKVRSLLKHGDAIGCFYIESPAMRMLLTKLKAEDYTRLVAASSIIRPGVAQSGMMQEYIRRFHDKKRREAARQALPELYQLMEETYGVMVYQEDVIKVAHYFAGLTLAEADTLRRGMSWKFRERNEFWKVERTFKENCLAKGYKQATVNEIWNQIESFGNYAFAKGHSASYAVESFQALFLKAYYPLEYLTATLNNGGGFYSIEFYIHEARMHGASVELPCVNCGAGNHTINGDTIYLGLAILRELEKVTIQGLMYERQNGEFKDLRDFVRRVPVSLEQLCLLIRAGAFRFTGKGKKDLLWDAHFLLGQTKQSKPKQELFETKLKEFRLPRLLQTSLEDAYDELELFGFPITVSPFDMIDRNNLPELTAKEFPDLVGKPIEMVVYLAHIKGTKTSGGHSMNFGTFIDQKGQWVDTVHFPDTANRYRFRGKGCYLIKGKVTEEFEFISVETHEMYKIPYINIEDHRKSIAKKETSCVTK